MRSFYKIFYAIVLWIAVVNIYSQTYNMSNTAVTTCAGTFYDSGGSGSNYSNNESFTKVFTPATAGNMLRFTFTTFNTEGSYDYLYIYDGPTTGAPLIGTYSGTTSPGTITATNATGQLTFRFTSDGSTRRAGWAATISCTAPPVNSNDCGSIVDLSTLTSPYSNSTVGAGNDFTTCAGGTAEDQIYYIDVPTGYTITIGQNSNNYDTYHSVYYGGSCPGSIEITCTDFSETTSTVWQNCTGSTQRVYWIQDGYSSYEGNYTLAWSLAAAPCPTCTPDMTINTTTYSATGLTTCGFGDDYTSSDACGSSYMNDEDIVIAWTPNTTECVNIELSGTDTWTGFSSQITVPIYQAQTVC